jgi:hypothetical protein
VGHDTSKSFGTPGIEPVYGRERTYDMTHVRLDLSIEPRKRTLRGRATLRFVPLHAVCGPCISTWPRSSAWRGCA